MRPNAPQRKPLPHGVAGPPNPRYFVYSASGQPTGSLQLQQTLQAAFSVPTELTSAGRSDHAAFTRAGIPIGGTFIGTEVIKTAAQAQKWSGTSGVAFDRSCDTKANTNAVRVQDVASADVGRINGWSLQF